MDLRHLALKTMTHQHGEAGKTIITAHTAAGKEFTSDFCDKVLQNEIKTIQKQSPELNSKAQLLLSLGIDFSAHTLQPLRAFVQMSGLLETNFFSKLLHLLDKSGIDLSDNSFNCEEPINLHKFFPEIDCIQCTNCIPLKEITKRSIYAKCRKIYGGWDNALNISGINPDAHKRKIASRDPEDYLNELFNIFETNPEWNLSDVRNNSNAWGLRHKRNQATLELYSENIAPELVNQGKWMFAAWIQYKQLKETVISTKK